MVKMEETIGTAPAGVPAAGAAITVHVKFGGRTISVSLSPSRLQSLTDVLPRGQRLIFKGKVVADAMSLKSLQITDGSKVMLIASQGLHQGAIPDEVWDCGPSVRVLDMCNNLIQELPDKVGSLKSLTKLYLNANDLSDGKVSWDGLSQLKSLTTLSFNHNKLTTLPSAVGDLISLTQLHIAKNKLTFLPDELGCLNQLQILKVGSNRISSVPASIGNCSSLTEIDLSSNLLTELPETFGKLRNLKALHLSNNGLNSLPSTLFKMCTQLSTLDLHRTEITNDFLRQIEGWEVFDERRRLKHQKQLDFHVGSSSAFEEGADDNNRL